MKHTETRFERMLAVAATSTVLVANAGEPAGDKAIDGSADRRNIEEVFVTAQKREERLQDVPVSISLLAGSSLDKSTSEGIAETLMRVPGVGVAPPIQGGLSQLSVRGVTAVSAFGGSSPVAYYLDSVPLNLVKAAVVPDTSPYDLQRIEVMRGPQGTLYGASAQSGVVRVLTADANLDELELKMRSAMSTTDHGGENYRGDLAISVPIIPGKLAARAVVGYQNLSGWIDKPNASQVNDAELRSTRLKVNAQPTEQLSIALSGWLSRSDYGAPSGGDDNRRRSSTIGEPIAADFNAYGLKVAYEFNGFTVTSATSYLDFLNAATLDLQPFFGIPAPQAREYSAKARAEEIILNSTHAGPWRWSAGVMYRDAEDRDFSTLMFLPAPVDLTDTSESVAVFGELTRAFLDGKFEVTGGLRYFEDEAKHYENTPQSGIPTDPLIRTTSNFHATSPRVVLSWHPNTDATVYASYAEGFRSGANQSANILRVAPEFPAVDADTLKTYEVGAKGKLAEGRFIYDAAVYYMDWKDVQAPLTVDIDGIPYSVTVNGESASGVGVEFGIMAQLFTGMQVDLTFSWNDLQADSSSTSAGIPLYAAGDRLNFSTEYTAGASAEYEFSLGSGGYTGRISAGANYTSEQTYRNLLGGTVVVDTGSPLLIARTSFSIDSPLRWTGTLFVDNLNNEQDPGVGLFHIPDWTQRIRPRTVGLQFDYHF